MPKKPASSAKKTARKPAPKKPAPREMVTQSEYARHRGVSPQRVGQWLADNKLVTEGEGRALRVDVAASNARIAKTRDPQQDLARKRLKRDAVESDDDEPGGGSGDVPEDASFDYWRTRREAATAKRSEALFEEDAGRLIDRAVAVSAVDALAREHRSSLLNLPARVAGAMAAKLRCSEHALRTALDEAIRLHLTEQKGLALHLATCTDEDLDIDEGDDD